MMILLLLSASSVAAPPEPNAKTTALEHEIKAAFIYNIAKFIEWPKHNTEAYPDQITLCIFGNNTFNESLETIRNRLVKKRRLVITQTYDIDELTHCQIVFLKLDKKNIGKIDDIISASNLNHSLTISDQQYGNFQKEIIQLYTQGDEIRFKINIDAANSAQLVISSRLQQLASHIYHSQREGQ